ncbi:MAG: Csu type fimbrial protein [Vicinamibacteraceae bacterium]
MKRIYFCMVIALGLLPRDVHAQGCSYTVSPVMEFGTVRSASTPQINVTATISVTCSALVSVNRRVCLSLPAGSGGLSIADRRMTGPSANFVQYQLYRDAGRTTVWGALGNSSPAVPVDFLLLIGSRTITVTIYGRVFAEQTAKAVGTYLSNLTPQARWQDYILTPSCQSVTSNLSNLPTLTTRLTIAPACTITANALSFGTATAMTSRTATSNLSVTCTQGGAYSIALNGGSVTGNVNARRMRLGSGPNTIDYQLYRDSSRTLIWGNTSGNLVTGTGTGSAQSIPVYGAVPAQGPKPPGVYRDTITATITF